MLDEVLYGSHCLEVSHAGGELSALTDLKDEWRKSTRQDRTERHTAAFEKQMEVLTDAYMDRCLKYADQDDPVPDLPPPADSSVYLIVLLIYSVQFHSYLSHQFSIAFDLYLNIHHATDKITGDFVMLALLAPTNSRMKNNYYFHFYSQWMEMILSSEYNDGEEVDKWAHKPLQDLMASNADRHDVDYNPCADRWKNMKDDITKRMWAIFDETGVFLALCQHGFSLVIADMVQSGELAKYPLAVVAKLLQVFGKDLGGGFDIGCRFKTTLAQSPLGPQAKELNYTSLVAVRYASAFHHMQAITTYFKYNDDMEVYQNLTTFLYNNYKQALNVINSGPIALSQAMQDLQISNFNVFEEWCKEEKIYLEGLSKEPIVETLEITTKS
ncbi:hypothetical protein BU17DRAFT_68351 [Hysterangium stoloniferum]|nr:hypothetical protein BU17DRAFT_68351 [Hysterangium stoloniferum]